MDSVSFLNRIICSGITITKDDLNDARILLEEGDSLLPRHLLMLPLYYTWSSFVVRKLYRLKLYDPFYPSFRLMDSIHQDKRGITVFEHSLRVLNEVDKDTVGIHQKYLIILKLAALFHDVGKISTMGTVDGKLRFLGHEYESVSIVEQYVDAFRLISPQDKKILSNIIKNHMAPLQYQRIPNWTLPAITNFVNKCFNRRYDIVIKFAEYDKRASTSNEKYIQPLHELLDKCHEVKNV